MPNFVWHCPASTIKFMDMKKSLLLLALAALLGAGQVAAQQSDETPRQTFVAGDGHFLLNGRPFVVRAAELHYPRIPRAYWEHRIKMCKALGMNAVCLYVFWNYHEQREGQFDFTGNKDVAAFCRLAHKHGLYVIVRPGPYVCAEWDMGGLPWWLLKKKNISLRDNDPYFLERVKIFEEKVAEQLEPLSIKHGGPIIMVQVENEFGAYAANKPYVRHIRDMLRQCWGTEMTLFQCDWASTFETNGLDDLIWTMNFGTGSNIDNQFRRLKEVRPNTPLMCSEFWSGWFDKWRSQHETRPADAMVAGIDEMLSKGISFSLYMTHGGTSFGRWAGANSPGLMSDVTSYDYDAPINEYGLATEKYYKLRDCLQKYADGKLPAVPKLPMPIIQIPAFSLSEFAPVTRGIDQITHDGLKTFEEMDMGWGSMIYVTPVTTDLPESTLHAEVHDYGQVFVNGKHIGTIDRTKNANTLAMPALHRGDTLRILVEGMGRINFGGAIKDYKGIVGNVTLTAHCEGATLTLQPNDWTCATIPDEYEDAVRALQAQPSATDNMLACGRRGYYRGWFNLKKTGDTFLNMETWGKGQVWINGHAIGRFWRVGPQQTLYVPGAWLKKGQNEIIVMDVAEPVENKLWGQDKPELDKLQLEEVRHTYNLSDIPNFDQIKPVAAAMCSAHGDYRDIKFNTPAEGRYVAIKVAGTHDGKAPTISEVYFKDPDGRRIDRSVWTVKYASSEALKGNHTGDKAFDLQESTYWQAAPDAGLPALMVIDLGKVQRVNAMEYLPYKSQVTEGCIAGFKVYVY